MWSRTSDDSVEQDPLHELQTWLASCTLSEYLLLLKIIRKLQAQWRGCLARMHAKNLRKLFQTYGYSPAHVKAARIFQKRFRGRKCRLRVKKVRIVKHVSRACCLAWCCAPGAAACVVRRGWAACLR